MADLLAGGDPPEHVHILPDVPTSTRDRVAHGGQVVPERVELVNAVATCQGCKRLFVSRHCDDSWTNGVYWVPLRWWHRKARRKLTSR